MSTMSAMGAMDAMSAMTEMKPFSNNWLFYLEEQGQFFKNISVLCEKNKTSLTT